MKLIIESKDYPHYEDVLTSPEKLKNLSEYGPVSIFDGTWELIPLVSWYSRNSGDHLSQKREYSPDSGWFFYSVVRFMREENNFPPLTLFHDEDFNVVKNAIIKVVLDCPIRQIHNSPTEIPREIRKNIVRSILDLNLEYPLYPPWETLFPCATFGGSVAWRSSAATFGGSVAWRSSAGSILCTYNHDFAIEVNINAWLHSREATPNEIALISDVHILEQSKPVAS